MATGVPEESMVSFPDHLDARQSSRPDDLIVAHDLGLWHYCQARKAPDGAATPRHWERVIGNWAAVLGSDDYWRDWSLQRGKVFGRPVTDEHTAKVRARLEERVAAELVAVGRPGYGRCGPHLEAAFHREMLAVRLIRGFGGIRVREGVTLAGGPLLAEQLGLVPQVTGLFQSWPMGERSDAKAVEFILHLASGAAGPDRTPGLTPREELRLYFSRLGIALVHLRRGAPERALDALAELRCPACTDPGDPGPDRPTDPDPLPPCCRGTCADFARDNPSYAYPGGGERLRRDGALLSIAAHLALAERALATPPANLDTLLRCLHLALAGGRGLGLGEALREAIADLVLGWVQGLKGERLEEAIGLLEGAAGEFDVKRLGASRAELLNLRGVQRAKDKRWAEAAADLRAAFALNPSARIIRENLITVLDAYQHEARQNGDSALASELMDEYLRVCAPVEPGADIERQPSADESPPGQAVATPLATPLAVLNLPETARNPRLFDAQGRLRTEVFDPSGLAVLALAQREAAAAGTALVDVAALLAALTRIEGGELGRLLALQGVEPRQFQRGPDAGPAIEPEDTSKNIVLTMFDLRSDLLWILDDAYSIAQFENNLICEPHLCYSMLTTRFAAPRLRAAGLDLEELIREAGWPG